MATLDEIGQEKQRISERLARIDAERTKLADHLNELEIAERVLTRFGGSADAAERRRRGRPARTAPAAAAQRPAAGGQRRARGGQPTPSVSLSDATLKAVQAHPQGATCERDSQSPVAGIRHGSPAEPPRYRTAAAPPRRPARKPRSALAPAAIGAAGAIRARRNERLIPTGLPRCQYRAGSCRSCFRSRCGVWTIGRAQGTLLRCAQPELPRANRCVGVAFPVDINRFSTAVWHCRSTVSPCPRRIAAGFRSISCRAGCRQTG